MTVNDLTRQHRMKNDWSMQVGWMNECAAVGGKEWFGFYGLLTRSSREGEPQSIQNISELCMYFYIRWREASERTGKIDTKEQSWAKEAMKRCDEAMRWSVKCFIAWFFCQRLTLHRFIALSFCRIYRFIASSLHEFASIALTLSEKKY